MAKLLFIHWIIFLHFCNMRCDYEYVSQQTDGDVIYYKHDGKLVTGIQSYHNKEMETYQSCIQICEADERCDFVNVIKVATWRYQCDYINATVQEVQIEDANSSSVFYTKRLKCPEICNKLKYANICGDCPCIDVCHSERPYYCNCSKVKASSCLDLKPYHSESGFYAIYLNGMATMVYCDMETDGGGWLMITNFTVQSENPVKGGQSPGVISDDIHATEKVFNGKSVLSSQGTRSLHDMIDFNQIRLYCYKPWHDRTIDITTANNETGKAAMLFLMGKSTDVPPVCGSYSKLDADNSLLFDDCLKVGVQDFENTWSYSPNGISVINIEQRMTSHVALVFAEHYYHFNEHSRLECDDKMGVGGSKKAGIWQQYVR